MCVACESGSIRTRAAASQVFVRRSMVVCLALRSHGLRRGGSRAGSQRERHTQRARELCCTERESSSSSKRIAGVHHAPQAPGSGTWDGTRSGNRSRWARRTRQVSCRSVVGRRRRKRVMTPGRVVVQIKRCCDCWAAGIGAALTACSRW